MANQESNTAILTLQSPKKTNFAAWADDLLLRESQVRERRTPRQKSSFAAPVNEWLRYVVEISPREYECLGNAAQNIRCKKCPCPYADRLNGMHLLDIHNDEGGRRPCTLTDLGKINVDVTEALIRATEKS